MPTMPPRAFPGSRRRLFQYDEYDDYGYGGYLSPAEEMNAWKAEMNSDDKFDELNQAEEGMMIEYCVVVEEMVEVYSVRLERQNRSL